MNSTVAISSEKPPKASMRILIVDDEVNLRFAIERGLRNAGHTADSATTVRQGTERLRSGSYDVVLCDLKMPGGDGSQLVEWLASYRPSTRIIVASAYITREFRVAYQHHRGIQIVEKPIELDDLIKMIEAMGPRRGFYGNAIEVELFDYVQMIALSGSDKVIRVRTPEGDGQIWFSHGDIVHTEYRGVSGEEAFYCLLASGRGTFNEVLYRVPPETSIVRSSTHLLMEATRRMDEGILAHDEYAPTQIEDEHNSAAQFLTAANESPYVDPFASNHPIDASSISKRPNPNVPDSTPPLLQNSSEPVLSHNEPSNYPINDKKATDPAMGDQSVDFAFSGLSMATDSGVALSLLEDPETRKVMLGQFFEYDGVHGVAILSSSGKVLAEEMRGHGERVTLAGYYMRGAARIARLLRQNVFEGILAHSEDGLQLLMVSMGAASAILSISPETDGEALRDSIMGL